MWQLSSLSTLKCASPTFTYQALHATPTPLSFKKPLSSGTSSIKITSVLLPPAPLPSPNLTQPSSPSPAPLPTPSAVATSPLPLPPLLSLNPNRHTTSLPPKSPSSVPITSQPFTPPLAAATLPFTAPA